MQITANQAHLKSWVQVPENSDFPIQNLPFGVVSTLTHPEHKFVAVRIGDHVLNLATLANEGYFNDLPFSAHVFQQDF
jgi:fumarylacetoacetase